EPALFAEELLGAVTAGYSLDDSVARRLADVTHSDVNLVADGRLYASSLSASDKRALGSILSSANWTASDGGARSVRQVGGSQYAAGGFRLSGGSGPPVGRLILLQDWQPTQRFLDEIERRAFLAGFAIFVVAIVGSLIFTRQITRPVQELAAAADDIARGNWT